MEYEYAGRKYTLNVIKSGSASGGNKYTAFVTTDSGRQIAQGTSTLNEEHAIEAAKRNLHRLLK